MTHYLMRGSNVAYGPDNTVAVQIGTPVVVIDPESTADVVKLAAAISHAGSWVETDDARRALRSLIAPPRPDEPKGLGAVVEDGRGVLWVRTEGDNGIRNPWQATLNVAEPDDIRQLAYADVEAVTVLSEGVTA